MKCFDCGCEIKPHEEVNYRGTTPVHAGHLACIAALKARLPGEFDVVVGGKKIDYFGRRRAFTRWIRYQQLRRAPVEWWYRP
jgi:hypothetical protein